MDVVAVGGGGRKDWSYQQVRRGDERGGGKSYYNSGSFAGLLAWLSCLLGGLTRIRKRRRNDIVGGWGHWNMEHGIWNPKVKLNERF